MNDKMIITWAKSPKCDSAIQSVGAFGSKEQYYSHDRAQQDPG